MNYSRLFIECLKRMNGMNEIVFDKNDDFVMEFFGTLRVSKISAFFYNSIQMEKLGKGNEHVTYDDGSVHKVGYTKRIVTDLMTVVVCNVYYPEGQQPWTPEELARVHFLIEVMTVYSSRAQLKKAAERYAFYDDEGYRNLRSLFKHIEQLSQKNALYGMAVAHINLKHFGLINQQIGREMGTAVIHRFYNELSEIVGDSGLVCRIGGDNFGLACTRDKLDKVLDFLSGTAIVYNEDTGERVKVSASVGVFIVYDGFVFGNQSDIMDKIITSSMAARKSEDTDIVFYSEALVKNREKVTGLQRLFPESLEREEFHVFYQPKININSGELVGAEALCRWFRDGRIVPPDEFIPILEQGQEICRLDFYMLDHVCRDIRRWLDEGRQVVKVSVNLSRKHMVDYDLLEHIIEIIDRNKVPHEYIEIELTETTTDVEFRDLKRVVNGLQNSGVCTSVDDFGMGYSSLNLIKEIPWNVIKVDKSFLPVADDDESSVRSIMFKYVISMAREMGLECIAEGVETQEQVDILRANGCDLAQGFFYDRPLPVEEFQQRLDMHIYNLD